MGAKTIHLVAEVQRITARKAEDDWSVLRVLARDTNKKFTVVGHTGCQPGQVIEVDGQWTNNPQYGRQFTAERILALSPTTPHGLASYLGSGVLPGVGPKIAQLMVAHFGMDLPNILDKDPARVSEIKGIGPAKRARVIRAWKSQAAIREIMLFLHSQGIPSGLCRRIHKALGDEAVTIIKENPYRLCTDVRGIGFKTADIIGLGLAIPPASEQRVIAGLVFQMDEMTDKGGHCGYPRDKFVSASAEMLAVPPERVDFVLEGMLAEPEEDRRFVDHDRVIYPVALARCEETIAKALLESVQRAPHYASRVSDGLIEWAAKTRGMTLANKQAQAVRMALTKKVAVITGGPGCGKTATLNVVLAAFRRLQLEVSLAAPTGKAAQRACEATGADARTIHRLLGIASEDDGDSEIAADVLVLDETSMVDVPLMARVARALKKKTTVVLVGDVDQLPSVGPGQVLADVIRSNAIPVTVLDEVFRQAAGSAIITNAHAINHGLMPASSGAAGDFFVLDEGNTPSIKEALSLEDEAARPAAAAEAVAQEIEMLVKQRLPRKYGVDPIRDVQILAPMNKGTCGVMELNRRLQLLLNPKPLQHIQHHGFRFGVGDKVIQRRNNYSLDIFNGDVGFVEGVGLEDEVLNVRFDQRVVSIPFDDLTDLSLAYAMTIHKSQGSQAPVVILPMVTQHMNMMQRNLLYTGVTRASRLAIVIGQRQALSAAVRRVSSAHRTTRLKSLLANGLRSQDEHGPGLLWPEAGGASALSSLPGYV